jgi:mono/diheme cytochrome c family protein
MTMVNEVRKFPALYLLLSSIVVAGASQADESQIRLRDGPRQELVRAHCATCHSLDYIQMNSVFLNREGWQKSVDKMIKVMGAPIRPEDVPAIVDYLTTAYGK